MDSQQINYQFLDEVEEYKAMETIPIRILTNPYQNVEFRFHRVKFNNPTDNLLIDFDIEVLKNPDNVDIDLNDQEFIDFVGEILYDIIVNRKDITVSTDGESNDDEPIDLEDDVHQESHGKDNS